MSWEDEAWLEVSLTVDGELAEAVAEVLSRYIPSGVVIESAFNDHSQLVDAGPLRVYGYLEVDGQVEARRREIEEALWYLGRIQPLPPPDFSPVRGQDWTRAWKKNFRPLKLGNRLLIQPSWIPIKASNRVPIFIDPGMAFGTGSHPSTQLCLTLLERLVQPGGEFIDVGCGSGILSIAAVKLGVSLALGVDIDEVAIQAARANAELNAVSHQVDFEAGSLEQILRGEYSLRLAPLVVANMIAPVLLKLIPQGLDSLVAPSGLLVLSGLLHDQEMEVQLAARVRGLEVDDRLVQGDWVALVLRRAG